MQNTHEPSDRFIERLGQDLGAEVRRRNRTPAPASWRPAFSLKTITAAAALAVASMIIGGVVVAAAYQTEDREQREALASVYERKLDLARVKLDAAKQELQAADRRVAVGLIDRNAALESRQAFVEAEAGLRIAQLDLEEVRNTGLEPRDELSAPRIPTRDFVHDRLTARLSVVESALDLERQRLKDAELRVSMGVADRNDVHAHQARVLELESALSAMQQKLEIRQLFVSAKYDAALADLRTAEVDAQQRQRSTNAQLAIAKLTQARVESLVTKGLAGPLDIKRANLAVMEFEVNLAKSELELSAIRAKIAERTAGKGGGS